MNNYKITNRETKAVQFMNAKETAKFIFKNDHKKYDIKNLDKKTLLDRTPEFVLWAAFTVLLFTSICLHIQLNY